jgi:hypothetical protein
MLRPAHWCDRIGDLVTRARYDLVFLSCERNVHDGELAGNTCSCTDWSWGAVSSDECNGWPRLIQLEEEKRNFDLRLQTKEKHPKFLEIAEAYGEAIVVRSEDELQRGPYGTPILRTPLGEQSPGLTYPGLTSEPTMTCVYGAGGKTRL